MSNDINHTSELDSPALIIEPSDLEKLISNNSGNLLIVDLGKEERFLSSHIPGAVLVTPTQTQAGAPIPGLAPSEEALNTLMQTIGLTEDSYVIVYDDEGGGWAGRFIWLLDEIGHTRYSYLNGGIHAWANDKLPLESGAASAQTSSIEVTMSGQHSITKEALIDLLESSSAPQIWDARSYLEHTGETSYAQRGGRIPGAKHYEWTQAMDQQNCLRLKPNDVLEAELAEAGITKDQLTITHCQTHHRSGLTYLIGKHLGFADIKAYPGSWGEWGNSTDTPIETN